MQTAHRHRGFVLRSILTLLVISLGMSLPGCAARSVRHSIIKRNLVEVDLVREKKGFSTTERGYEHPAIISKERLVHILNAIEIESPGKQGGTIRQPAFHHEIVEKTAQALSTALREAEPNTQVGVKVVRKQMRLGVFDLQFLTAFLAYVDDDHLYLLIRRVEWPIPQSKRGQKLPEPQQAARPMDFRVVSGDPIYFAGVQDLEIDWKNDVFRAAFRLPGTTSGEKRVREVILQSPIPKSELEEAAEGSISYDQLTPEQLRALADLEEERREGRITETAYQRAKRQLLRNR